MAKKDKEQLPDIPETMEDYMLQQLKKTVILKDGNTLKDPHDGHELTAEEAIAHNMINAAMNRIRQLFDEFIGVVDKTTDQNAYAQVLKVFSIGYQLGWNDQHNIAKMERTININGN